MDRRGKLLYLREKRRDGGEAEESLVLAAFGAPMYPLSSCQRRRVTRLGALRRSA